MFWFEYQDILPEYYVSIFQRPFAKEKGKKQTENPDVFFFIIFSLKKTWDNLVAPEVKLSDFFLSNKLNYVIRYPVTECQRAKVLK